jgi:hypothetical protein
LASTKLNAVATAAPTMVSIRRSHDEFRAGRDQVHLQQDHHADGDGRVAVAQVDEGGRGHDGQEEDGHQGDIAVHEADQMAVMTQPITVPTMRSRGAAWSC